MYEISIYCPHCRRYTALTPAPGLILSNSGGEMGLSQGYALALWRKKSNVDWWIGVCNSCKEPVLVRNNGWPVYPQQLPSPTDTRIPEGIRKDLDEAKLCCSAGAYRACAVMARRAVQVASIDKGASANDNLVKQIDFLESQGIITKDIKTWAHAVRWIGNDGAHPNALEVEKDDAEEALQLAEQLLHILYVTPSIAEEQRNRRHK